MEHHLRVMASEDCVLSFRTSGPNYRTKQMVSGDAQDPWVTGQQIGTQSLKGHPWEWCFHPWKVSYLACCWCCPYSVALRLCFCDFTFAAAILVKRSLSFFSASAVLLPAGIFPWSAVGSCWAAFVIYWCLKKLSLILVAVAFQRRCCS